MKIDRLVKGEKTRTLQDTSVGNEIIDGLNALMNAQFLPTGICKLAIAGQSAVYTFDIPVGGGVPAGFIETPAVYLELDEETGALVAKSGKMLIKDAADYTEDEVL